MGVVERAARLGGDPNCLGQLERCGPASGQHVGDRPSANILRDDERIAVFLADIVHAHDIGMLIKAGHRLRFTAETIQAVRLDLASIQDADHHVTVEFLVTRQKDSLLASLTQARLQNGSDRWRRRRDLPKDKVSSPGTLPGMPQLRNKLHCSGRNARDTS